MEALDSGREAMLESTDNAFFLANNPGELTRFHNVYNHSDKDTRENLCEAINKKFEDMKKKEDWEVISK
jgi:hypothetical protein